MLTAYIIIIITWYNLTKKLPTPHGTPLHAPHQTSRITTTNHHQSPFTTHSTELQPLPRPQHLQKQHSNSTQQSRTGKRLQSTSSISLLRRARGSRGPSRGSTRSTTSTATASRRRRGTSSRNLARLEERRRRNFTSSR